MSNNKVYDCRGKLTDSEGNKVNTSWYASNEDYIFTICVSGASRINIKFSGTFNVEALADFIKIYDGKDTFATLIKKCDNNAKPTGTISTTDSCVTFYFHSDKFVNGDGFELSWEAKITSVPQPKFSPITDPTCNSTKIRVVLDQRFNCDSVKAKNFKLTGTLSTAITNVTGISCDSKNETNTFDVTFASGLNKSGNYTLDFNSTFKDKCDSIWKINAKLNFKITDCPIKVVLTAAKDTICKGSCTILSAVVTGGNAANYSYTWLSGGLSGKPPHNICPTADTRYILQVSDGVSVPGKDTVDIVVVTPPIAQNDTTVCQSSGPFNLTATPAGGKWSGTGITNTTNGTFNPGVSGSGVFTVSYKIGNCSDNVVVTVRAINAGPPNAACPNSPPFMVSNFSPPGGTWSGSNITSAGMITPPASSGSFIVTYSWNGCTSNKTINIDGIVIPQADTICKSKPIDTIAFSPVGGVWTGPGLTNNLKGISVPYNAGPGNKLYIYTINGCRDTLKRYIREADARWDEIACPDAGQRLLPAGLPAGGFWKGKGMYDTLAGIFDADTFRVPGKSTFTQVTLIYTTPDGCKDDKIMYLRYTRFYTDTVKNCVNDTAYFMRYQYLQNDPWNIMFTGSSGIVGNSIYYQKFSPSLAGRGTYQEIVGDANGCKDTIIIQIYPRARIQKDTTFCIADDPFKLYNGEGKGTFSGPGITNATTGMFSPSIAGAGNHIIYFTLPGKCRDTIRLRVNTLPIVKINGLSTFYCFRDTMIPLSLSPSGGTLTGKGIIDSTFHPRIAGTGNHTITYQYGTGKCINKDVIDISIGDTLKLNLSADKDTICIGATVTLTTQSTGGSGMYDLRWNSGQQNVSAIFVSPKVATLYTATLRDGCSDSVVKQHFVYVHPQLYSSSTTSTIQCYGNMGFIDLRMKNSGVFTYNWNTLPPQQTAYIAAPVGNTYKVNIKNTVTGCTYDTMVNIPGYKRIRAYFSFSPNDRCLYSTNAELQIINLSEGGITGYWDFGDGTVLPYDPTTNPTHLYDGLKENYKVKLEITNDGNCKDSFSVNICVIDTVTIVMPTAFTPNNDGMNDVFKIESTSLAKATMTIYNRWGEKVFFSDDPSIGWDGTYQGKICPTDYYVYYISYKGKKTAMRYSKGVLFLIR
ncbi:MAG: gliding motility-associated C-terminal domain-containing protein [Bacteroidota bacterium]